MPVNASTTLISTLIRRLTADPELQRLGAIPGRDAAADPAILLAGHSSRIWGSATFDGAEHEFELRVRGEEAIADRVVALLDGADFDLAGHALVECRLRALDARDGVTQLRFSALTVED